MITRKTKTKGIWEIKVSQGDPPLVKLESYDDDGNDCIKLTSFNSGAYLYEDDLQDLFVIIQEARNSLI